MDSSNLLPLTPNSWNVTGNIGRVRIGIGFNSRVVHARRYRVVMAFATTLLCASALARQGSMELIEGKGLPICEAYAAAAEKWEATAVGCIADLPLDGPKISRVTGPIEKTEFSYDEDDPTTGLRYSAGEFVNQHDINLAAYFYSNKLSEWRGSPEQVAVARQGVLNRTNLYFHEPVTRVLRIDVDNDGASDQVYFHPHCASGSTEELSITMSSPVILTPEGTKVDSKRTLRLLRDPIARTVNPNPHRTDSGMWVVDADVFSGSAYGFLKFDGRTYFDFWWDVRPERVADSRDRNSLRVFLPAHGRARPVCVLRVDALPKTPWLVVGRTKTAWP